MSTYVTRGAPIKKTQRNSDAIEDFQEWENHLIIRFPPEIAPRLRKMLDEETRANDMFSLSFDPDMRSGTVRFDQQNLPFKLHDLPTVTEVMKTLDNKTVFKVADLCQMMVCSTSSSGSDATEQRKGSVPPETSRPPSSALEEKDESDKVYRWPHGLCPPMRNVQKRRFRKTKKKKYMDAPDVEKELKRLLRADLEAVKIEWDIVSADSDKQKSSTGPFYSVESNPQNNEDFDGRSGFIAGDLSLSDSGDDEASQQSIK